MSEEISIAEQEIPRNLLEECTKAERSDAQAWWNGLAENSRFELNVLHDSRCDSIASTFATDESENGKWHSLPIGDDPLPFDDPLTWEREWRLDYFDHLQSHPEQVMSNDVTIRTFHICVAHEEARGIVEKGKLQCDFQCPVNNSACPIRRFASGIQSATLLEMDADSLLTTWLCVE